MKKIVCDVKGHIVPTETDGFYSSPQCSVCKIPLPTLLKDLTGRWFELYEPTTPEEVPDDFWEKLTIESPCETLAEIKDQGHIDGLWEDLCCGHPQGEVCCDSGKLYTDCCYPAKRIPTK